MKKLFMPLFVFLAFNAGFVPFAKAEDVPQNLIVNGSFDENLSSWKKSGRLAGKADATWVPNGDEEIGAAILWFSKSYTATAKRTVNLYQDFAATAGSEYLGSAYLKAVTGMSVDENYKAYIDIIWFDSADQRVGSKVTSAYLTAPNDDWGLFSITGVAPEGAVTGRLGLKFDAPIGSNTIYREVSFDNASIVLTPEPLSSALFLLGGAAIAISRRKRS
jgi:hypothetical protein